MHAPGHSEREGAGAVGPVSSGAQRVDGAASRARVLIVDDSATFLTLLHDLIGRTAGLVVAGQAESGEGAVELYAELRPDIALIDVNMPGLGGIGAARQIKGEAQSALVVLISTLHPAELPAEAHTIADAVIAKADLEPDLLDRLWRERSEPCSPDTHSDVSAPASDPPSAC